MEISPTFKYPHGKTARKILKTPIFDNMYAFHMGFIMRQATDTIMFQFPAGVSDDIYMDDTHLIMEDGTKIYNYRTQRLLVRPMDHSIKNLTPA